jgi:hypothetical protein
VTHMTVRRACFRARPRDLLLRDEDFSISLLRATRAHVRRTGLAQELHGLEPRRRLGAQRGYRPAVCPGPQALPAPIAGVEPAAGEGAPYRRIANAEEVAVLDVVAFDIKFEQIDAH